MSQSPLPDDLERWPSDPYALLGVQPGVPPRELRRAYTRLIRFYKPEQYPEQFRRIRAAYESVLSHVTFFDESEEFLPKRAEAVPEQQPHRSPEPDSSPDSPSGDDTRRSSRNDPSARIRESASFATRFDDPDELWQRAINGDEQTAYRGLRESEERRPGHVGICARLYWLLTLWPDLEPDRSPCDWLARGLRAGGLAGSLRELYRRELAANPHEALTERCAGLLTVPCRPGDLLDLVSWRWQAAMMLERYEVIRADLPGLRPHLGWGDEEEWARVLFTAVDCLAWSVKEADREAFAAYMHELYSLAYLGEQMPRSFDRLDMLCEIVPGWQKLKWIPPILRHLIPLSWCLSIEDVRGVAYQWLDQIAAAPFDWLAHFDKVQRHAPMLLTHIGEILRQLIMIHDVPLSVHDPKTIQKASLDFLALRGQEDYRNLRTRLLEFSLREAIPPERVAAVATHRPAEWPASQSYLDDRVNADWPLRYVYMACQLFWA